MEIKRKMKVIIFMCLMLSKILIILFGTRFYVFYFSTLLSIISLSTHLNTLRLNTQKHLLLITWSHVKHSRPFLHMKWTKPEPLKNSDNLTSGHSHILSLCEKVSLLNECPEPVRTFKWISVRSHKIFTCLISDKEVHNYSQWKIGFNWKIRSIFFKFRSAHFKTNYVPK